MNVPLEVQREADARASRWWMQKGNNRTIRVNRVRMGAVLLLEAIKNLDVGDVIAEQRRTLLLATAAIEQLQKLCPDEEGL